MDVLIVDDEPVLRNLIAFTLRQSGYKVTTASNGQKALALWQEQSQQLIVSDFTMPGMTGLALCQAIRALARNTPISFIMLTGHEHLESVRGEPHSRVDDLIVKPFRPVDLVLSVNTGRNRLTAMNTSPHSHDLCR